MIVYEPSSYQPLNRSIDVPTAWNGLERIIPAILLDFNVDPVTALEFGVQHGFSTAALANYFQTVTGVDTFRGDEHAGFGDSDSTMQATKDSLAGFPNVNLVRSDYKDFINMFDIHANLAHVDIVHTFEDTYQLGLWAVDHCDCVLFHDTESFPDVKKAVAQIALERGLTFHNYPHCHGLGILRNGR
ncbi:MAG: class I SAM-dependent methyltransferase [Patescibacteria group bacterium]|nr:class I SAM-dependent methyltransferase [Patescibacteria group bacterium]